MVAVWQGEGIEDQHFDLFSPHPIQNLHLKSWMPRMLRKDDERQKKGRAVVRGTLQPWVVHDDLAPSLLRRSWMRSHVSTVLSIAK